MDRRSGVYAITNAVNGKRYIGSAVNFHARWGKHLSQFRRGVHHNVRLQRAWSKYGKEAFRLDVLIVCAREHAVMYEQIAMDALKPEYNLSPTAGSLLGIKHGDEFRRKVGDLKRGRKVSDETRARLSAAFMGKKGFKHSEQSKKNMAAAQKARDKAYLAKLHAAKVGVERPPDVRAKIGKALGRLSEDDVRQIRARVAAGEMQKTIAAEFGMRGPAISDIVRGATYRWVE